MEKGQKRRLFTVPTAIALGVVLVVGLMALGDNVKYAARGEDKAPEVDFTWTPIGPVTLKEMVGRLHVKDDFALDFGTFRVYIVELDRTLEIVRPDVIGKEFDGDVHFTQFDEHPVLLKYGRMTLEISIADDRGQETKIERVVKIKRPEGYLGSVDLQAE